MTISIDRPATADGLFLWVMHRFAEVFKEHAILKGGMAMRLIDSPRSTTDIEVELHSNLLRAELHLDSASIQLEVNVGMACTGIPMSTGGFARTLGHPPRIVRIMSLDWGFAHKLAAWNERRLARDLYDCYFFAARLGQQPAEDVLDSRLACIISRIPAVARRHSMTRVELAAELRAVAVALTQQGLASELGGVLPSEEIAGLAPRMKAAMAKIAEWLEDG